MPTPTDVEIARQAEYLWRLRGSPRDQDPEIWIEAGRQLRHGLSSGDRNPGTITARIEEETAVENIIDFPDFSFGSEAESFQPAVENPAASSNGGR